MTSENQALLDAIRGIVSDIVSEAVVPLTERVDGLTERVLLRLLNIESRLDGLEAHAIRLEENLELLDGRTGQIARDQFETQQQLDRGFRSLKRETMQAMSDLAKVQGTQKGDQNRIRELEEQILTLQQRLEKIEARYNVE